MNAAILGRRQSNRSSSSGSSLQSQRQSVDSFVLDPVASSNGMWLHQADGGRLSRPTQGTSSSDFFSAEPATPHNWLRNPGRRKNVERASCNDLSPGLLDIHSIDTELLPEKSLPGISESAASFGYAHGRGFDDFDPSMYGNKSTNKSRIMPESNIPKFPTVEKSSVAKIKVVVRKRPLNKKELSKKEEDIISIESNSNSLVVHETKLKVDLTEYVEKHEFVFDAVLDEDVSNDQVYRETVEPIVPIIFHRTKATCFAYGQTGSGKTFTMQPLPLRASYDILRLMHNKYHNQGFQLFVSFFEIYGGKLFDLLNDRRKLCMREDGKQQVCIVGLLEYRVADVDIIRELIEKGNATRSTGTTGANEESSRSHAILQLAIKKSVNGAESKPARLVGKLSFIDLAGSERGADTTDNDKQTRIEGAEINKSLLALKECIRALDNDQTHIPFRGSKLTEVLRDSFIGDSRTVMISCISPNAGSCEHTLNTLRYADRVKSLSKGNNPRKDTPAAASLRESTVISSAATGSVDFVWPRQAQGELIQREELFSSADQVPSTVNSKVNNDYDYPASTREVKPEKNSGPVLSNMEDRGQRKKMDQMAFLDRSGQSSDDDLNALLKEEEDLVTAHRRQVEETIDMVREEMKLLVEADQPGNQLDSYISQLNSILSRKAAGILNLQTCLANFQRRLTEHDVLTSSHAP
ncbi:ATP binding microtubule motor family protein [Wolffia australiana]